MVYLEFINKIRTTQIKAHVLCKSAALKLERLNLLSVHQQTYRAKHSYHKQSNFGVASFRDFTIENNSPRVTHINKYYTESGYTIHIYYTAI